MLPTQRKVRAPGLPVNSQPSLTNAMQIRTYSIFTIIGLLAGCGADVATTALTVSDVQSKQAQEARAQEALVKEKLNEALKATSAAAASAAAQ